MKAADAALFGASWWPYASFEKLRIATYLSIWVRRAVLLFMFYMQSRLTAIQLFAWDDGRPILPLKYSSPNTVT